MSMLFGPAGNSDSFSSSGHKRSAEAPAWLSAMGLDAYEYQCGRGVRLSETAAKEIGRAAADAGIVLSLHSPYFINLSAGDRERKDKNLRYILDSALAADRMGARRIVVHCGGLGGLSREEAGKNTAENLREALALLESEKLSHIFLCVETMGKIKVYGDLSEVCRLCSGDDRLIPCVDFGHLNARTGGGLSVYEDFVRLFDTMEALVGKEKARRFHGHFSKIEYSSGGEVRHLTFADEKYGPDFAHAARIMAERGYEATIICESAGTQAEDALTMKRIYERMNKS